MKEKPNKDSKNSKLVSKVAVVSLLFSFVLGPVLPVFAQEATEEQPQIAEPTTQASDPVVNEEPGTDSVVDGPESDTTKEPSLSEDSPTDEEKLPEEKPEPEKPSSEMLGDEVKTSDKDIVSKTKVDEATGALVYNYPLAVPPGRNGLTPEISLRYNNQLHEEGWLGAGWTFDIPYIERVNKKGVDKLYTENYFAASIDGELVQVGSTTEYKPKVEDGDFNKYVFSSNTWTVTDKEGTVYKFGHQASTRQDKSTDATKVIKWFVEEIRDTNDNYIKFEYYKESGQIYPSKITYTGHGTTDGDFEIVFLREARPDNIKTYSGDFLIEPLYRINEVRVDVDGSWVRKYELGYSSGDNSNRSLLTSLKESGRAEDLTITTLPDVTFNYETSHKIVTTSGGGWGMPDYFVVDGVSRGYAFGDVNGDGLVDLLYAKIGTASTDKQVYINDGTKWVYDASWALPTTSNFTFKYGAATPIDINGDGLVDLVFSAKIGSSTHKSVYLNTGSGWTGGGVWSASIPTHFIHQYDSSVVDYGFTFGDVNGDGLPDLLYALKNSSTKNVYINDGTQWVYDASWVLPSNSNFTFAKGAATAVDINRDNLVDIVWSAKSGSSTYKAVYINNGHGWATNAGWSNTIPSHFFDGDTDYGFRLVDINNDGLVDIGHLPNSGDKKAYISNGEGWYHDPAWVFSDNEYFLFRWNQVRGMDIDGDGLTDFVASAKNGSSGSKKVYLNQGNKPDLLEVVTHATGGSSTIEYKQTPLYMSGSTRLNPDLEHVLDTVFKITNNDAIGNSWTDTYSYEGGDVYFTSYLDKKFAGFSAITKTNGLGNITKTFYHQGNATNSSEGEYSDSYAKIGKPYRMELRDASNNVFRTLITKWEEASLGDGANFVKPTRILALDYDGDGDHRDRAEEYGYNDDNGNLVYKAEWGEVSGSNDGTFTDVGSDNFFTNINYAENTGAHILGLKSREVVENSLGIKLKESKYYYDAQSFGSVVDGNLTKREDWVTGSTYIDTENTYNAYGLVVSTKDPGGKITTYAYDFYDLYPETVTNPLSHSVGYEYDYSSGNVTSKTDENGQIFETIYDGLDRVIEEKIPNPLGGVLTKATYEYTDNTVPTKVKQTNLLDAVTGVDVYKYLDGFGRLIQQRTEAEGSNSFAVVDYAYNDGELLEKESLPYFSTGSSRTYPTGTSDLYTTYTYDALNRKREVEDVLGSTIYAYDQWMTSVTDAENNVKEYLRDAYDNLSGVIEHNDGSSYTTTYAFDHANNLTKITDALGNIRTIFYDGIGRRTALEDVHDPSDGTFGVWSFEYDKGGNLLSRTDPKNQVVEYTYDGIHRVLTEDYAGQGGVEVVYAYDSCTEGIGRLCSVISSGVTKEYDYDVRGNIASESTTIDSTAYTNGYTYDRQDNILTVSYPDASQVRYTYNTAGQLETVEQKESGGGFADIVADFDYSPAGKITHQAHANGSVTNNTYDVGDKYRLSQKITSVSDVGGGIPGDAQHLTYIYDAVGNITQIVDASDTDTAKTIDYTYDDLYRLTSASTTGAVNGQDYQRAYTYDAIGNILSSDVGSYVYAETGYANPHAVTSVASTVYVYDNNGNITDIGPSINNTWDYENRLVEWTDGVSVYDYTYDYTGERVKKTDGVVSTIYPNKYYLDDGATITRSVFAEDALVANIDVVAATPETHHVHTDHLGGTNVVTDESGVLVQLLDYYPYGSTRIDSGTDVSEREFSGHFFDEESELSYMGARYYDGGFGRFMSQDPVSLALGNPVVMQQKMNSTFDLYLKNPQAQNSYSYTVNNPLKYKDKNGEWIDIAVDVGFTAYSAYKLGEAIFTGGNVRGEAANLALDAGGALIPGVVGAGTVRRVLNVSQEGAEWLNRGEKTTDVYIGAKNGDDVYVGISKNVETRAAQHGDRFDDVRKITPEPYTRNQSRAIEQVNINQNPRFQNKINSISPQKAYYKSAINWAKREIARLSKKIKNKK